MTPSSVLKKLRESFSHPRLRLQPEATANHPQPSRSRVEAVEPQSAGITSPSEPTYPQSIAVARRPLSTSALDGYGPVDPPRPYPDMFQRTQSSTQEPEVTFHDAFDEEVPYRTLILGYCDDETQNSAHHSVDFSDVQHEAGLEVMSTGENPHKSGTEGVDDGASSAVINFDLAGLWLRHCEQYHGDKCDRREAVLQSSQIVNIILIDTKRNCLVEATTSNRFFALSYVWGSVPQFHTTSAMFHELMQENELSAYMHVIPQVICDAMQVVRAMGETYLWVDSLCIIQDDEVAKHIQISHMAEIYNGAVLTIIAVAARDAHFSLPGVRDGTRWPRSWRTNFPHFNRPLRPDLVEKAIDRSLYVSRAWTFQERHLSRRCLYFLDEQIYFQCRTELWCEEPPLPTTFSAQALDSSLSIMALASDWADDVRRGDWNHAFLFYSRIITEYSRKNLTYPEDVLSAFTGILSSMEAYSGWRFYQGLPAQLFDWALLWVPVDISQRREGFPSWSWVGWIGGITFDLVYEDTLLDLDSSVDSYSALKDDAGVEVIERQVLMISTQETAGNSQVRTAAWKSTLDGATNDFKMLQFGADTIIFANLDTEARPSLDSRRGEKICTCSMLVRGVVCGVLLGIDHAGVNQYEQNKLKLIAFSRSKLRLELVRGEDKTRNPWKNVNVMLVIQQSQFESEINCARVAVGIITKEAWRTLGPVEEGITLA